MPFAPLRHDRIICIAKLFLNRPPGGPLAPNDRLWQAFRRTHHIDIPPRDEPDEAALLIRCCAGSSASHAMTPNPLPQRHAHAALPHRCTLRSNRALVIRNRCFSRAAKR
ncbi:hypothetical protein [Burkholderia pyrrocinia]|uniref:hypothetical protein n=1 Tax=Burkholderia pyrrocinia TaxID=60550 RepID=UPI001375196B|nr:hypothetical protein [Burkholderia pyrrocinia]